MKKLLAIDGNSIINRAFYGIRLLTNKAGEYTNAVYGLVNIVMRQVEALKPDYCAVAFDVHSPTFRHEMFDAYKAGRHATPEELLSQIPLGKQCLEALGFHVLEMAGYEADDILGTLARTSEKEGIECYVLTGDRDSLQLISDTTRVLLATNSETVIYDREKFKVDKGVDASQYVDVKALMGDSSDNIPGVRGIGEKTAFKLISDFGSLDALYRSLPSDSLSKSVNEKLIEGKESAVLSRCLSEIYCEVPIISSVAPFTYEGIRKQEALDLFTRLEFSGFIKRFELEDDNGKGKFTSVAEEKPAAPRKNVDEKELCELLKGKDLIAYDYENKTLCFGQELYEFSGDEVTLAGTLCSGAYRLVVYDCKTLYKKLNGYGACFGGAYHDVMLGAYVLDPAESSFDFARLCVKYLGVNAVRPDADKIFALYQVIEKEIGEKGQQKLLYEIEMPLARVLADMEIYGCRVDVDGLISYGQRLCELEKTYRERIYYHAGGEFNINSPKQLGEILFERLALPGQKKTKTGYSTGADILEKLRPYHPIIDDILDYRQVMKLRSTYAEGLCKAVDDNHLIHSNFKQTGTATGRLSSTEPNLQNIPIKTELGREFRRFFIPRSEDHTLIDADYSQIELRLLAEISGDETMQNAFLEGADIHTSTAARVFGVSPEEVTPELRKRAKAVNFGIVYGIGDFSLSQDLHIPRAKAREYIDGYLATYPGVAAYLKNVVAEAYETGFVTTLYGRRRYIPELKDRNKMRRSFGERVSMNSPIQGTAADIIKIAMIRVSRRLSEEKLDARLVLQVHDELLIECARSEREKVSDILKYEMEHAVDSLVPLLAEVGVGDTWYECH